MGRFFKIMAVKSAKTPLLNALKLQLRAQGYVTDNRNPEFTLSCVDCGGWMALRTEDVSLPLPSAGIACAINRPVLEIACFDSDGLLLTLHHLDRSDCAAVGHIEGEFRPDADFWSLALNNFHWFTQVIGGDYVFAEEALDPLGEVFGFDGEKMCSGSGVQIGFSRRDKKSPRIEHGPARFDYLRNTAPSNFGREHTCGLSISNFGGPGKGVFVIAEGEILERDDIRIDELKLWSPCQRVTFPFEPMTAEFYPFEHEGRHVWRADFPDFIIPPGVNPDYRHPSTADQMKHDFEYSIVFNFIVHASSPVENLILHIVPMENPSGEYTYRQADCDVSSADTEDMQNGIISANELVKRKRTLK